MVYETDPKLDPDLQKFGCAVESLAVYNPDITDDELNAFARVAHSKGIIDSDDVIDDWQGLANLFGYPLKYREAHYPPDTQVDPKEMYLIGEWHNPNNGFTHFVVMDGKGIDKSNVSYDPIQGGSKTVREGSFVSYRIFDKV